jgi:N-acetylmuramoyl-L-alanine amidase
VIGIDPGHNGGNFTHTTYINHLIFNGREMEHCNTTGTATDAGYTEATFDWRVAGFLARDIRKAGGRVVLTRHNNHGVGPCVNERARIIDATRAAVAIDIHADGGPSTGRGFTVLVPVPDRVNRGVVTQSRRYGRILRNQFRSVTGMPVSTYDGVDGIQPRSDLAGLNLTTVPEVLIECGNMRNRDDARLLTSRAFQEHAARAIEVAMSRYLLTRR